MKIDNTLNKLIEEKCFQYSDRTYINYYENSYVYYEVFKLSSKISFMIKSIFPKEKRPVIVSITGKPFDILLMFGVLLSGNFYIPIDCNTPKNRKELLFSQFSKDDYIVIGEDDGFKDVENFYKINEERLNSVSSSYVATVSASDYAYGIFTSGSTGIPKLVVKTHENVMAFIFNFINTFCFDSSDVFANQLPFYFDAASKDIFLSLYSGAKIEIIPRNLFFSPRTLFEFLYTKKVSVMIWVPSALQIAQKALILDVAEFISIKYIMFVGERINLQCLFSWFNKLKQTIFVNLYAPTEVAGNCLFHIVKKEDFEKNELPLGIPLGDVKVELITDNFDIIHDNGVSGEIIVYGKTVSSGYFCDVKKTSEVFGTFLQKYSIQNICYRTGDIARYNYDKEVVFLSRKDLQIKHMGYRINLQEIETNVNAIAGINNCACIYDSSKCYIILFYSSCLVDEKELANVLSQYVPRYMMPNKIFRFNDFPLNSNGKIDRKKLEKWYYDGKS